MFQCFIHADLAPSGLLTGQQEAVTSTFTRRLALLTRLWGDTVRQDPNGFSLNCTGWLIHYGQINMRSLKMKAQGENYNFLLLRRKNQMEKCSQVIFASSTFF